jgi:sialate O-acetylesterase
MKIHYYIHYVFFILSGLSIPSALHANVRLPTLVDDHMVLQRGAIIKIWGWADPEEKVTVQFLHRKLTTYTTAAGRWEVSLPSLEAGGPYEMKISGKNLIKISDILIGDVWLCSGQSNMEYKMIKSRDRYADDIAKASQYPIREFAVKETYGYDSPSDVSGSWQQASPENVLQFTAVGYFFAKNLNMRYKVPIGLLYSAWSGTPAEAWISEKNLQPFPHYLATLQQFKDTASINRSLEQEKILSNAWYKAQRDHDQGSAAGQLPWSSDDTDLSTWRQISFPGYWEDQGAGNLDGVIWVKKVIEVPSKMSGKPLILQLGLIDESDSTYFNGHKIGSTNQKGSPRRYRVPAELVKPGSNTITIRIIDNEGKGGFVQGKPLLLTDGQTSVDLAGQWIYRVGFQCAPLPAQSFTRPYYKPGILYQTMIAPIAWYPIKGAIWYQGEANTSPAKAVEYRRLLPILIKEWRKAWGLGDFPFLIVQLANFMKPSVEPQESSWAMLRESQAIVADSIPRCGLAVAIDLGEAYDIHPANKKDVADRLALVAGKVAYHNNTIQASGPVYENMFIDKGQIFLTFKEVGKGLIAANGRLLQFAIAGTDRKFVSAEAKIVGPNQIVVWSDKVKEPVAVRYAWADNPEGCNLLNKEGLPARPFRTDNW